MVLMTHAFWKEEPTRKFKLSGNIWFIVEALFVTNDPAFCFLHLNLTITVSFFFKWWHASRFSSLTSWPVSEKALQMLPSRTPLPIDVETRFISNDSRRWYCAFLTAFLSNWTILSLNKRLQFFVADSSEERISYLLSTG